MASFTFYDTCVPMAQDCLNSLSAILKKGEEAPNAASLPEATIHADMKPLTFQVHVACDMSQKMIARTSGKEPLTFENDMKTFADMHARIAQTQELLAKADKETINAKSNEIVPLGMGPGKTAHITSAAYVGAYFLPNVFFHLTTAYDILRKEGVPVGKMDYLLPFLGKHVPAQ